MVPRCATGPSASCPDGAEDDAEADAQGRPRMKERRTQLRLRGWAVGGARRWRLYGGVAFGRVWCAASAPRRMCKLGALLSRSISGARVCARRRRRKMSSKCKLGQEVLFWPRRDGGPQFFFCALVRRLRNVLGMTNQPWLQRETGKLDLAESRRNPFFSPARAKNRNYASFRVSD